MVIRMKKSMIVRLICIFLILRNFLIIIRFFFEFVDWGWCRLSLWWSWIVGLWRWLLVWFFVWLGSYDGFECLRGGSWYWDRWILFWLEWWLLRSYWCFEWVWWSWEGWCYVWCSDCECVRMIDFWCGWVGYNLLLMVVIIMLCMLNS